MIWQTVENKLHQAINPDQATHVLILAVDFVNFEAFIIGKLSWYIYILAVKNIEHALSLKHSFDSMLNI